ncbi:SWIM zinc finger family protein [Oculatella sp. LEGE 06141]|uniref:SWIM zinc finger family protein n=1 Tax=Oculatella sp. LEGE 06141 TaxID=1828648 RepID=UPI001D150A24|nr:SWIM zinc finger family protein [Oculatella sp. LEGE 06141]
MSEATIRHHTIAQSFERGQGYYRAGSVHSLIQRGDRLLARVEGSEATDYQINVYFDQGGITRATCTCPYDYEGWCKHIVAVLLTCLNQPDRIEHRPALATLLASLNREQLETIVQNIANEQPEWMDAVEVQIALLTQSKTQKSQKAPRRTTVDPKPIERQVKRIINRYVEQWNDEPALDEIREIIQKADKFLEQGDGNNALIILGAIVRAYVQDWMNLDGSSGESGAFFEELDDALTEAILSAELTTSEFQQWQKELKNWQKEVVDYGVDSFEMSLTALQQGWEYPPLQEVLQGNITELGAWEDEAPDFADDLAWIRLKILERQGRHQEYLYLAEAEGQTDRYLQMLTKLGRSQEAIALAEQEMSTAGEAWTLAKTLRQQGELKSALNIAMQGLSLGGSNHYGLAVWASELAEGIDLEIAFQTRLKAFQLQPSLPDYLKLKELAGHRWDSLQPELLDTLRQSSSSLHAKAKAAIFLEEGLIEDAIATVTQLSSYESDIIHPVMDAAIAHRPDWVIENARPRAESIINAAQAQYYHHALNWLRRVRAAYLQLGQQEEWHRHRTALMQTHTRKHKLVAMLQQRDLT